MIGLDTNVLLRLFLDEELEQCERAQVFVRAASRDEPCAVNAIVVSEFAWTLARRYKKPRDEVARYVEGLLNSDDLEVTHRAAALAALASYRRGRADFPDYFLAEINAELGCSSTATFDRDALDSVRFSPIP